MRSETLHQILLNFLPNNNILFYYILRATNIQFFINRELSQCTYIEKIRVDSDKFYTWTSKKKNLNYMPVLRALENHFVFVILDILEQWILDLVCDGIFVIVPLIIMESSHKLFSPLFAGSRIIEARQYAYNVRSSRKRISLLPRPRRPTIRLSNSPRLIMKEGPAHTQNQTSFRVGVPYPLLRFYRIQRIILIKIIRASLDQIIFFLFALLRVQR